MSITCFLEAFDKGSERINRTKLTAFPFSIGRSPDCDMVINSGRISRHHAHLVMTSEGPAIEDLGSTNGTFLNRHRLEAHSLSLLSDGDIVHFAELEFRFVEEKPKQRVDGSTEVGMVSLQSQFPRHAREFREMLAAGQVTGVIQPIVDPRGSLHAYELLGRGFHPTLPEAPGTLFTLARALGLAVDFSELLRQRGVEQLAARRIPVPVFVNTHPQELENLPRLIDSLTRLTRSAPDLNLVLEIHEAAVAGKDVIAELQQALKSLRMGLAYDDFGAGQARLLELVEVPPDYLKFDGSMTLELRSKNSPRYRLLSGLVELTHSMGIASLAECVEDELVSDLCHQMGIDYYQGYLYGRPQPIIPPETA